MTGAEIESNGDGGGADGALNDEDLWSSLAGPPTLGRSLLLKSGDEVPAPWKGCKRIRLNNVSIADPATLETVRSAFLTRTPVVFEMEPETNKPSPGEDLGDVWTISPTFDFVAEAVWRLATSNSVDARDPMRPIWPLVEIALRDGAVSAAGRGADVVLPHGALAWCDGGPLSLWQPSDERLEEAAVVPRTSLVKRLLAPIAAAPVTASLAPDQLEAVSDPSARARIIAPAGSGKTRVLTERARYVLKSGVPAASLLLLAFNARAQGEMRDRTTDLPSLQIQTLNALGLSIINGTKGFLPRGVTRKTIDKTEVRKILYKLVKFPRKTNVDPVLDWIAALTEVRLGLRSPVKVEASYGGDIKGFAEFFPRYRQYLADHNLVDFDEQIYLAIEVLLREWRARFAAERNAEVLLVDEFQDFNPAHMLLVRLLAGPALSVFAVGDDDQTIYGYSGATPEWLVEFEKHVPEAAYHALEVNYRCPVPVITAALNLLSHNHVRVIKQIRPGPTNVVADDSLRIAKVDDQPDFVANRVRELLEAGAAPTDIAVLSRVNAVLFPLFVALAEVGVPVTFRDAENFLSGSGVEAALAWLRLGVRPESLTGADIMAAVKRPGRGISKNVIEWMGEQSSVHGLERLAKRLDDPVSKKIADFAEDLERLSKHIEHGTSSSTVKFIEEQIGLDSALATLDASRQGKGEASTFDGMRALIAFGRMHSDPKTFEAWLRKSLATTQDVSGVLLSSVHKVKGLEWPHVIVYDASDGIFPHRLSGDIEEERRVFHVAITRCMRSLTVVADSAEPSVFLSELSAPYVARAPKRPSQGPRGDERSPPQAGETRKQYRHRQAMALPAQTKRTSNSADQIGPRQGDPIVAVVGLMFRWSGYQCLVSSLNPEAVEATVGATSRVSIPFGERVQVAGQYRILVSATGSGRR